ncbi:MAG: ATP-dependent RecD-like DNA helicase [Nitriliruptorales bacterium]|nr:ATP-dependent RecD-like DNA helicase [Nitriliruptorales bacterium]
MAARAVANLHGQDLTELTGEVAAVVFANPDSGFGVVELTAPRGGEDGARASGPLASLVAGQSVRLLGTWKDHERYGETFEAVAYEHATPRSVAGLVAFLASERFAGVGQTLAKRMVTMFGLGIGEVITAEPHRLAEVKGVSEELAASIAESWRAAGALAGLVSELNRVGLPPAVAAAVHRHFGDRAGEILVDDPYALLVVRGVRWAHAEALARTAGVDRLDPRRLRAAAIAAQRDLCGRGGHMAVGTPDLVVEAGRLLGIGPVDARRALDLAVAAGGLVFDRDLWWTPGDLRAEQGLAGELARLVASKSALPAAVRDWTPAQELTEEQRAAVAAAVSGTVSVLTGGPGTGKTRTIVEILAACLDHDIRVSLCAPTGRAAKRMEELTGHGASTIHRLLEARGEPGHGFSFGYDAQRRLPHDVVIADEWSMTDTRLAWALVQAVPTGAHLVLVGDSDQLPSVGAGAVLRDLLNAPASEVIPASRLTVIHRQAAQSRIVTLAHEVNHGEVPPLQGRSNDVFVVPEHPAHIADRVAEIVAVRAPRFYELPPTDVQVLAPMYRGAAGVDNLNATLKERLNPAAGRRAVAGFHEGDRVVQTRNDAELDVANGDIGQVAATDPVQRTLEVAYPHGTVTYDLDHAADLQPAWCLTVHKSQGGEWPVVVLVLDGSHRAMLWRELVYTAITRARRGLLLVGSPNLLTQAAARTGSGARSRRTLLGQRLVDALQAQGGDADA